MLLFGMFLPNILNDKKNSMMELTTCLINKLSAMMQSSFVEVDKSVLDAIDAYINSFSLSDVLTAPFFYRPKNDLLATGEYIINAGSNIFNITRNELQHMAMLYMGSEIAFNEKFKGIRYNFQKKYSLKYKGIYNLVTNKAKTYKGWILKQK
jgi:hypothetical protein